MTRKEFTRIKEAAKRSVKIDVLVGIGGSYLGARAVVEAVRGYHNDTEDGLKIYFCGNIPSPTYLNDIKVTKG